MFPFKATLSTANVTKGTNSKQYIVLHHTATKEGSIKGVLSTLTKGAVSCHFVVDANGDAYKIGSPDMILWHAGESKWGKLVGMNAYSLGIEIVGPLKDGGFSDAQKATVRALVAHLMATFGIPAQNVLRHKDVSPGRKVDVADAFWNKEFRTYDDYRNSIKPKAA